MESRNRFQRISSASLYNLAGLYDKPISTRFLAPIDCLKIPAQESTAHVWAKEYWMIYRGTGFLATYNLAPPHPFPAPSPISKLDRRHTGKVRKRENMLTGEDRGGWGRSQIIRWRESLVLYKLFKTLWCGRFFCVKSTVQRDRSGWK